MVRTRAPSDPTGRLLGNSHWPVQEYYYYPPDKYIAIHIKELRYLAAGEQSTLWRAVVAKYKHDEFLFGCTTGTYAEMVYDTLSFEQLATLWQNTLNVPYAGSDLLADCVALGGRIKALPISENLLHYNPENPPCKPTNNGDFTPESRGLNQRKQSTPTHTTTTYEKPLEGTKTGLVWSVASDVWAKYRNMTKKQLKDEIVSICTKQGINPSTAQVQFGKWYVTEQSKNIT